MLKIFKPQFLYTITIKRCFEGGCEFCKDVLWGYENEYIPQLFHFYCLQKNHFVMDGKGKKQVHGKSSPHFSHEHLQYHCSAQMWMHLFMENIFKKFYFNMYSMFLFGCSFSIIRVFPMNLFHCLFLWQKNLAAVLEKEERVGFVNGKEDMVQVPTISSSTSTVLKSLFMVLDFLYRDNCRSETTQRRSPVSVLDELFYRL